MKTGTDLDLIETVESEAIDENPASSYEEAYANLNNALSIASSKDSSLDEVIKALEDGLKAHKTCSQILDKAKQRVDEISIRYGD